MYTGEKILRFDSRTGKYTVLQHKEELRPTSSAKQSIQNAKSQEMKLYNVHYKTWNVYGSDLVDHELLSCGKNTQEAINRVKSVASRDAGDFSTYPIENIFGHKIIVR